MYCRNITQIPVGYFEDFETVINVVTFEIFLEMYYQSI